MQRFFSGKVALNGTGIIPDPRDDDTSKKSTIFLDDGYHSNRSPNLRLHVVFIVPSTGEGIADLAQALNIDLHGGDSASTEQSRPRQRSIFID